MEKIKQLILKRLKEKLSVQEEVQLESWMEESSANRKLVEDVCDTSSLSEIFTKIDELDAEKVWTRLEKALDQSNNSASIPPISLWKKMKFWYAAAVVIFGLTCTLFLMNDKIGDTIVLEELASEDISAPNSNYSTITLSNGKILSVDSISAGLIAVEGEVFLYKHTDGTIQYVNNGSPDGVVRQNILSVPKGSQISKLVLADGSQLTINAGTTLKYAVAFSKSERRLEIVGEAYLEIAREEHRPFIIESRNTVTQVLGTHFNVNAYKNETDVKITLLEGKLLVIEKDKRSILNPGEQAICSNGILSVEKANIGQTMAWKNGLFDFQDKHLPEVMRELSRWYNLEIIYTDTIPDIEFFGQMNRSLNLSEVLTILKDAGLKLKVEDRKVFVL